MFNQQFVKYAARGEGYYNQVGEDCSRENKSKIYQ